LRKNQNFDIHQKSKQMEISRDICERPWMDISDMDRKGTRQDGYYAQVSETLETIQGKKETGSKD